MHVTDSNILILNTFGVGCSVAHCCTTCLSVCTGSPLSVKSNAGPDKLCAFTTWPFGGTGIGGQNSQPGRLQSSGRAEDLAQSGEEDGVNVIKVMP